MSVDFTTILAPMAGYTDFAFRSICRNYGVGLTVTEMVSSKALVMRNGHTQQMLHRQPGDVPCFCQIFGHEPEVMAESARLADVAAFDGVDINMGCPAYKIIKNGDGYALMGKPRLASRCISAVKEAIGDKPLSVKIRLGVENSKGAVNFVKMCADNGADFVTVHFRTGKQGFTGAADYTLLPKMAKVGIPVFANGDVKDRETYLKLLDRGASGVAVGRAAQGRPQIFAELIGQHYSIDYFQTIERQAIMLAGAYNETYTVNEMKKHVAAYLKFMFHGKAVITEVMKAHYLSEILTPCRQYFDEHPELRREEN